MKLLIIEDEAGAAAQLTAMLQAQVKGAEIMAVIDSVEEAVRYLSATPAIDLIFLDIYLSDGISFDIFRDLHIDTPVIFTTAYDQYAIRAFELNSIDYLLKPLRAEQLQSALDKYRQRKQQVDAAMIAAIRQMMGGNNSWKKNFLIPFKDRLIPVPADAFAYFETSNGIVRGIQFDKKMHHMEETLEELAEKLDPALFYRANRQYLVSRRAIVDVQYYFNGRLYLNLVVPPAEKVLVSKAKAGDFKAWMGSI